MSGPSAGVPERPRARDDVVFRALAREWVVYDPRSRNLHVLNLTAALVWSLCDGGHDAGEMVREIRASMAEAPPEGAVRKDVTEALGRLAAEGLFQ